MMYLHMHCIGYEWKLNKNAQSRRTNTAPKSCAIIMNDGCKTVCCTGTQTRTCALHRIRSYTHTQYTNLRTEAHLNGSHSCQRSNVYMFEHTGKDAWRFWLYQHDHHRPLTLLLNNCAETHLGGQPMSILIILLTTVLAVRDTIVIDYLMWQ